jgi:hypothetical protein
VCDKDAIAVSLQVCQEGRDASVYNNLVHHDLRKAAQKRPRRFPLLSKPPEAPRSVCNNLALSITTSFITCCFIKVGQNRIYTPYMTVFLVISLPKILYIHRTYMVLANPMLY